METSIPFLMLLSLCHFSNWKSNAKDGRVIKRANFIKLQVHRSTYSIYFGMEISVIKKGCRTVECFSHSTLIWNAHSICGPIQAPSQLFALNITHKTRSIPPNDLQWVTQQPISQIRQNTVCSSFMTIDMCIYLYVLGLHHLPNINDDPGNTISWVLVFVQIYMLI